MGAGRRLDQIAARLGRETFLGVPVERFAAGGREQLIALLRAGLDPDSKVADLGCGCLRGGYWLIHFLDPGCYCGIEPHAGRLEVGLREILEPAVLAGKRPRFDANPSFDTSVFGERFDFFLARSIWTHAPKRQIEAMLDNFVRDGAGGARFLTSYLPADDGTDYAGDAWVGTSHESAAAGCIRHAFSWIASACDRRGLAAVELPGRRFNGQVWIDIRRAAP